MQPTCHPERTHLAKGLCNKCYLANYRQKHENKVKARESLRNWEKQHLDFVNERKNNWAKQNPEKVKETKRKYVSSNLHLYRAQCAKRHAHKLQRTPKWADLKAIKQFYLDCPVGMEVDHIIPLQGQTVSGLHVLNNLQYLTKSDNCKKGNRF